MQKAEWRILSTGLLPQALIDEAAAQNVFIDIVPFIETRPVINDSTATQIQELFQKPITAVFTSSNAVHAVATLFQKPMPWRIYSIGRATATAITQLFQVPIAGSAPYADALADLIIKDGVTDVFFFCGTMRRDVLPEKLQNANISITEIVVYETVEIPQAIETAYDAVLFFSPSSVHSFFSTNKVDAATMIYAIGNTTAEPVRQYTSNPVVIAQTPDKDLLIRQVLQYFNPKKQETE